MVYKKNFVPLESDPAIFTELMHDLGVSPFLEFVDVWSLEDDMIAIFLRPVLALILILPPCPTYEKQQGGKGSSTRVEENGGPIWLKQTIDNACGLYAILHAVCNIPDIIKPQTVLDQLVKSQDNSAFLETSEEMENSYVKAALKGSSKAPSAEAEVDHHYVTVKQSNRLYVLDGEMHGPLDRDELQGDEDVLSKQALDIINEYILSNAEGMFSLLALVRS